jgi:hypothetical protein
MRPAKRLLWIGQYRAPKPCCGFSAGSAPSAWRRSRASAATGGSRICRSSPRMRHALHILDRFRIAKHMSDAIDQDSPTARRPRSDAIREGLPHIHAGSLDTRPLAPRQLLSKKRVERHLGAVVAEPHGLSRLLTTVRNFVRFPARSHRRPVVSRRAVGAAPPSESDNAGRWPALCWPPDPAAARPAAPTRTPAPLRLRTAC